MQKIGYESGRVRYLYLVYKNRYNFEVILDENINIIIRDFVL